MGVCGVCGALYNGRGQPSESRPPRESSRYSFELGCRVGTSHVVYWLEA